MSETEGSSPKRKKPDSILLLIPYMILLGLWKLLASIGRFFLGCLMQVLGELGKILKAIITKLMYLGILVLVIYVAYLFITGRLDRQRELAAHPMDIQAEHAANDYVGRNVDEVIEELKEDGFTNVQTECCTDLTIGFLKKDGDIASLTIDGVEDFDRDTWFPRNADIRIIYHTFSKISKESLTLKKGRTAQLSVVHCEEEPEGWTSSNPEIASVDASGLVTAEKKGTARITLWICGEEHICEVRVK